MPEEHRSKSRPTGSDDLVSKVVGAFLSAVDAEAPGLVEAFYLTGSVALADFRPHESDTDFVALVTAQPAPEMLARAHSRLAQQYPRPLLEGVYLSRADLARDPALCAPAPAWHDGSLQVGSFALDPITWHTLAWHGVRVRGPYPSTVEIWTDLDVLTAWTLDNLESYWRPWRERFAEPSLREGVAMLGDWAPAWGVLGVSRLHYTLATGGITSKEGAGLYALQTFPSQWHRVIEECLRIRRGEGGPSLYPRPEARREDALAYIAMAIDDAQRLYAPRPPSPLGS